MARVLAPDDLVDSKRANAALAFLNCPVLEANGGPGLTPLSAIKLTRHRHWHETMHHWCPTAAAKECVLAALVCEMRLGGGDAQRAAQLPVLPPELWLHAMTFIRRDQLAAVV